MDDGSGTANGTRHGITEATHHGDGCTTLLGVLQRQQDLVAWKLRDVPDDVLGAVATPTGMGLLSRPSGTCRCAGSCCTWLRRLHATLDTSTCCASGPTAALVRSRPSDAVMEPGL